MSLNSQISGERIHIGFFGLRNSGKSSVVNAVTGQALSLVSDVKGTTTDPVKKAMELLPLGPVVIIDTPGIDDEGQLGRQRVKRTYEMLEMTDIAVLIVDAEKKLQAPDRELLSIFKEKNIPWLIAWNKSDLLEEIPEETEREIYVSATCNTNIYRLKEKIGQLVAGSKKEKKLLAGLVSEGDNVVLVVPIDKAAPKGRLILPQQQTIRELLDAGAVATVTGEDRLTEVLENMKTKPKLVITDSQVFDKVWSALPKDQALTSFSILFAGYKGDLNRLVLGAEALDRLKDGDVVLISEGCTHHRQCDDIGSVKLPAWIGEYTGHKDITFEFSAGNTFPEDLSGYALVIHCGGCMLSERQMLSRIDRCSSSCVPVTNYGVAIAQMKGILKRALGAFEVENKTR